MADQTYFLPIPTHNTENVVQSQVFTEPWRDTDQPFYIQYAGIILIFIAGFLASLACMALLRLSATVGSSFLSRRQNERDGRAP